MSNKPMRSVVVVGFIATVAAMLGLCYNGLFIILVALRGSFPDRFKEQELVYFYVAFYVMFGICVLSNLGCC
jgi:hypothetical protein